MGEKTDLVEKQQFDLESMVRVQLEPEEFQSAQKHLNSATLVNISPAGCQYEEVLAEILSILSTGVILDKHTSFSRTTWLAGRSGDQLLLMVVDAFTSQGQDFFSLDVWTDSTSVYEPLMDSVRETRIGDMSFDIEDIALSWKIEPEEDTSRLVLAVSSKSTEMHQHLLFTIDYQGLVSETFKTELTEQDVRVVVALDVSEHGATWDGNLDSNYLVLHVTDAEWKSSEKSHSLRFSWGQALEHVVQTNLKHKRRYRDFEELAKDLNIGDENARNTARRLFFSFCLNLPIHGCASQRTSYHCSRTVLLTGLAICFNPKRGMTGYLEMITENGLPNTVQQLGSNRTWRAHISEIVETAEDFVSRAVTLSRRKNRRLGRPPLQLIPTTPPSILFETFISNPEDMVCGYCRFSER